MTAPALPLPDTRSSTRPLTIAILAMGGEGGGVLADWIVEVAENAGWTAQNTSVAGVAQRTGATVYYVELMPPPDGPPPAGGRAAPVLGLFPTPGEVDVVIASELMECGRAIQRGFTTPDRTVLIASTNRVYSIDEKIAPADGRVDSDALLAAAQRSCRRLVAADFAALAEQADSVISASLFGALAGSGALPFSRNEFEAPIRAFAKAAERSLRAFSAGHDAASEATRPAPAAAGTGVPVSIGRRPQSAQERKDAEDRRRNEVAAANPERLVGPRLQSLATTVLDLPAASRSTVLYGLVRTAVYQDERYARRYLDRVGRVAAVEPDPAGAAALTRSAARNLAVWMCYQDTIQVALQKTRRGRFDRIRAEARAGESELVQVREYLHPGVEEITDTLPAGLGAALRRSRAFAALVDRLGGKGIVLRTTSVTGVTALAVLARLRPLRTRSLRFRHEQTAIDSWLDLALGLAADDPDLGREVLECQQVLKGYGSTHAHGSESLALLLDAARRLGPGAGNAERLAGLRRAALADEDGTRLRAALAALPAGPTARPALEH